MGIPTPTSQSRPTRRKAAAEVFGTPTSLADALFTTTRQRVLLLYGQPNRSSLTSKLIGLTG